MITCIYCHANLPPDIDLGTHYGRCEAVRRALDPRAGLDLFTRPSNSYSDSATRERARAARRAADARYQAKKRDERREVKNAGVKRRRAAASKARRLRAEGIRV